MKKRVIVAILILALSSALFALDDYAMGYLKGFEDAINGEYSEFINLLSILYDETYIDDDPAATPDESDFGDWQLYYYVDSFGDDTDEAYASTGIQNGTFSNSATINSNLDWRFIIDKRSIAIKLWEYGSYVVNGSSRNPDVYYLQVKDARGNISEFRCTNSSDRLTISMFDSFLALLRTDQKLKIIIEKSTEYGTPSKYNLGNVDVKGFDAIYRKLIEK